MKLEEEAYIILGCFGRTENNFVLCPSIKNKILKLDERLVYFHDIMNYLDNNKLFDRSLLDINAINNFIYHMQDRYDQKIKRLWTDQQFHLNERFIQMHRHCGLYIKLTLDVNNIEDEDKKCLLLIKG